MTFNVCVGVKNGKIIVNSVERFISYNNWALIVFKPVVVETI